MTIDQLKELERAGTEGPWVQESYYISAPVKGRRPNGEVIVNCTPSIYDMFTHKQKETNAALIVALRNAAPALIKVAEAAKEQYRLPLRVLIETGIRPGEAVALQAGDVQEDGIVVCKAIGDRGQTKETKSGRVQFKRVSDALFADLQSAGKGKLPGAFLFVARDGRPLSVGVLSDAWKRAARIAKVDAPLYEGTRHSFATRLRQEKEATMGRELAKEMGHYSAVVTIKHYAPETARREE